MSRPARIASIIGLSLLGLLVALFIAVIIIVNTSWFQNYVIGKIVTATEQATGGKVEVGSFNFDLWGATRHRWRFCAAWHGASEPPLRCFERSRSRSQLR